MTTPSEDSDSAASSSSPPGKPDSTPSPPGESAASRPAVSAGDPSTDPAPTGQAEPSPPTGEAAIHPTPQPTGGTSAAPTGDRIEPGGQSVASGEGSQPEEHSPTAETPDLADPPPEYSKETTPGEPTELDEWDAPVTSIPADSDDVRPVTAVPAESLPIPMPPVTRAPLGSAFGYPARFANAPGTGYHLALPQLGTIVAGPAVGSMVAGIGASIVAIGAGCSLFLGPLVSAASSILAVFGAGAGILLAGLGMRQIRRGGGEFRGTGMAITGLGTAGFAMIAALFVLLVSLLR
ncbi:hypothetical protein FB566_3641 [Stackebrandtia endophytica]|uniref:DUF4190 domain-containing protein n=1 Tax=Stackebrandtia endophytica TaxID=1496996 RepID=A0A543AZQ6_9ACTN|nr:hypothetical protein [Stackebrandtia endophytica]TQL78064.1 hypothetical protein FB566_3641 [Stackebrandtia endophytica]